jgi:hypothetical protein
MLMSLRNAARNKQGSSLQGAVQRRLSGVSSDPHEPEQEGDIVGNQTPEDVVVSDIEAQQQEEIEPPDIPNSAAQVMMRYGMIQNYLARARGEMPDG